MADGIVSWTPQNYTAEENSRWVWLRAEEWGSYPNFLAPLWGIFVVYFYGWVTFLITLVVATFIWKLFIMKSFVSIRLLSSMAVFVNFLKWPLAIIFAGLTFFSHHGITFSLSLLLFPAITYFCAFFELPYNLGGIMKQGKRKQELQTMIFKKLGLSDMRADPTADKGKHPSLL